MYLHLKKSNVNANFFIFEHKNNINILINKINK